MRRRRTSSGPVRSARRGLRRPRSLPPGTISPRRTEPLRRPDVAGTTRPRHDGNPANAVLFEQLGSRSLSEAALNVDAFTAALCGTALGLGAAAPVVAAASR
ncbi:MAG: hypothetical protein R2705_10255 [Ilumatobacteraceae bacterium]